MLSLGAFQLLLPPFPSSSSSKATPYLRLLPFPTSPLQLHGHLHRNLQQFDAVSLGYRSKSGRKFESLRCFSASDIAQVDVLRAFFEERKLNGDFISKACDMLWQREVLISEDVSDERFTDTSQEVLVIENDDDGGFLKLSSTQAWVSGGNSAPINKKAGNKILTDDRERKKKLDFLRYEALKRELLLLSVGIGTACSGYCLIVFSFQAAISYAVGVLSSCLYLQLLYQHADRLSKDMIPDIFTRKKTKKIGIRSEDINNAFEKTVKGSSIALSSPRLVIPAAIYALWIISHKYLANDVFEFQLTPAMFGMFVYKAAALVQVYRDNEDLMLVFPDNDGDSA